MPTFTVVDGVEVFREENFLYCKVSQLGGAWLLNKVPLEGTEPSQYVIGFLEEELKDSELFEPEINTREALCLGAVKQLFGKEKLKNSYYAGDFRYFLLDRSDENKVTLLLCFSGRRKILCGIWQINSFQVPLLDSSGKLTTIVPKGSMILKLKFNKT